MAGKRSILDLFHLSNSLTKFFSTSPTLVHHNARGRKCSYGVRCYEDKQFKLAILKGFTRQMMRRFGVDTSVEDMILLTSVGSKGRPRRLDPKKRKQLARIYTEYLLGILCEDAKLAACALELTKIDVSPSFVDMTISWKAKGDGTDEETQRLLDQSVGTIRRKLSEAMSNATVPQLKFVADRTHLIVEEMNQLFAKADYGMQYRALSNTGAVLGSMSDSGIKGSFSENHQSEIQKNAESKTQSVLGKFSEDEGPSEKNKPDR